MGKDLDEFIGQKSAHVMTEELDDEDCEILEFNDFGIVYNDNNGNRVFIPYNALKWVSI